MTLSNPAEILARTLERGKAIAGSTKCRHTWANLLSVDDGATGYDFLARLAYVMSLPQEIVRMVERRAPHRLSTISIWHPQVEAAFAGQNLNGAWSTFIDNIHPECIVVLDLTSEMLRDRSERPDVQEERIFNLGKKLDTLLAEVQEADLDPDLKADVVAALEELSRRLRRYAIDGVLPVVREAESQVGRAIFDLPYMAFLHDTELGKRVADALSAAANLATVAVALPALSVGAQAMLRLTSG